MIEKIYIFIFGVFISGIIIYFYKDDINTYISNYNKDKIRNELENEIRNEINQEYENKFEQHQKLDEQEIQDMYLQISNSLRNELRQEIKQEVQNETRNDTGNFLRNASRTSGPFSVIYPQTPAIKGVSSLYRDVCDTYGPYGSSYYSDINQFTPSQWCNIGVVYNTTGDSMRLYGQASGSLTTSGWRYQVVDNTAATGIYLPYDTQGSGRYNTLANGNILSNIPGKPGSWTIQIVENPLSFIY